MDWLVANWNNPLDVSSFKGSAPGLQSDAPSAHARSVADQIKEGLLLNSTWLPDMPSHLRDGLQMASFGLRSSMEYDAATRMTSSHSGWLLVISHLYVNKDVIWKARLLQSTFNSEFYSEAYPCLLRLRSPVDEGIYQDFFQGIFFPKERRVAY